MSVSTLITADEYAEMSFDRPVELIRGEVVELTSPGGVHGCVCFNVNGVFWAWTRKKTGFRVFSNDTGILTERDPDTVRGPDVAVVRESDFPGGRVPRGIIRHSPELCVEVRSPSDRWSELLGKVGQFLDAGVKEVWVIDPDVQKVHVYSAGGDVVILRATDVLRSGVLPELEFPVADLFRGVSTELDDRKEDSQ